MKRRRFIRLAAAFACAPALAQAAEWRGIALGARVSVTLHGPRDATDAALSALPRRLARVERLFSLFDPDSALSFLNRQGGIGRAPAEFLDLLRQADRAHHLTDGLFDPTVQPLWQALALGTDPAAARRLIGWQRVSIDALGWVRMAPGQALTLNGIAQGFATDLVRQDLAALGFDSALVDIGEQAALGGPFRLTLEDPRHGALGQRTLNGGAIATSSPGALMLGTQAHILAPDGRAPLWSTLSVEAPSATLADALSTAAVFMDRAALERLKARAGLTRITAVTATGDLLTL